MREILNYPDRDYARHVLDDPDRWARIVANAIRIETIEQMVRGISYEPIDETDWWDAEVVFLEVESKNPPQPLPGNPDPKNGVIAAPEGGVGAATEAAVYGGPTRNPWDTSRTPGGSSPKPRPGEASAAADPPPEPPGTRVVSQGFNVGP